MWETGHTRSALKRGALLTAANWPLVVIQTIADSAFKLLLAIPILGGALLVIMLLDQDPAGLVERDLRDSLAAVASALASHPAALVAFGLAFGLVALGGSGVMFLLKGGTVSILVASDRAAGRLERPPLRLRTFQTARQFSIERFTAGASRLFGRYLAVGLALVAIYTASTAVYAAIVYAGYRQAESGAPFVGWTLVAGLLAVALGVWTTVVNLLYLLTQIVIAETECGVGTAVREVGRFLRADARHVVRIFAAVLLLLVGLTALSLVATAGLGLIAFVPLAGVAVVPLQLVAWLLRNLLFQFLGLTALSAYLTRYRACAAGAGGAGCRPRRSSGAIVSN